MVGNGDAVHSKCFDPLDNVGNAAGPVKQGIMGMAVKMDERAGRHGAIVGRGWPGNKCPKDSRQNLHGSSPTRAGFSVYSQVDVVRG
jgi:hypothetical protein